MSENLKINIEEQGAPENIVVKVGAEAVAGAIGQEGAERFANMFDENFESTPEDAAVRTPEAEATAKIGAANINEHIRREREG